MAIRIRNKVSAEFSMASMSDLVFLLLIFFMLTSTLVSPNAVKLLLPTSNSRTMAKPAAVTVYIDDRYNYYLEDKLILIDELEAGLLDRLYGETEASVVLRADKSVELQYVVSVIDAVNNVNNIYGAKNKVILATKPK